MNKKVKIALLVVLGCIVIGAVVAYRMWNKPHRDVATEDALKISAAKLVKDYQAGEPAANALYLDKAVEVTGNIADTGSNQEGQATVLLSSEDAFTGVFCTLREKTGGLKPGQTVVLKGICSGMLSDVRVRDAIIVSGK